MSEGFVSRAFRGRRPQGDVAATRRFSYADRFIPDRADNAHLGFGGSMHYCVGAPLARPEAQIALGAIARRLVNPRLVQDPPPYRQAASLRGPRHLLVAFDRLAA